MKTVAKCLVAAVFAVACVSLAYAQNLDPKNRKEIKRTDLTGTNMEVILSTNVYRRGDSVARHIHHGVEAFYVIQGSRVRMWDGKVKEIKSGYGSMNLRDVTHGGFTVIGRTPIKVVLVHIVDKGKPLYDAPPK